MKANRGKQWIGPALIVLLAISACGASESAAMPTARPQSVTPTQPTAVPTEAVAPDADRELMERGSSLSPLSTPAAEAISPLDTPGPPEGDAPALAMAGDWAADGVITDGEYTDQADFGDIRLWWRNDADYLYMAMEGDTTGWVAVGINPERGMQGANYLFGFVKDGEAKLWDAYGTAPTGPNHPPDEDLGGTNDIVTFAGIEGSGITRFEVQIPLDSGDAYDQALTLGQSYAIIIALGDADDYNTHHRRYDRGELTLTPSP